MNRQKERNETERIVKDGMNRQKERIIKADERIKKSSGSVIRCLDCRQFSRISRELSGTDVCVICFPDFGYLFFRSV